MQSADDRILLCPATHQRDTHTLKLIYEYYLSVLKYIAKRVGPTADAEDLAQDVFVQLCKNNALYKDQAPASSYLLGIAKNLIRDYYRHRGRQLKTVHLDSIDKLTTRQIITAQKQLPPRTQPSNISQIIRNAVAQLPPKARQAIKLRFIEGLSPETAAEKAGCSLDTFCSRTSKALKLIRQKIVHSDAGHSLDD